MSLYGEYIAELEGKFIVEDDKGFLAYLFMGDECLISAIYVRPEFRKKGAAAAYADVVSLEAKKRGCKFLSASVETKFVGATDRVKVLLAYGFQVHSTRGSAIWFKKDL